jgi:HD-GYP domain-containing protein (c-di-GMP phosphodiesterase class II)
MALKEMKEGVGKQFDPALVEVFLKERLYDSLQDYAQRIETKVVSESH